MSDTVWKRDEIQSPCIKICVIHPESKICTGCYRTLEEIAGWSRMTHEQRSTIMGGLDDRKASLTKRRGGRQGKLDRLG